MTTLRPVGPTAAVRPECGAVLAGLPPFPPLTAGGDPGHAGGRGRVHAATDGRGAGPRRRVTRVEERDGAGPGGRARRRVDHLPAGAADRPGAGAVLHARRRHDLRHRAGRARRDARPGRAARRRVVSVEYRLAPETPHPARSRTATPAWSWTAEHADELGIDRDRLVLIGGSAGGGHRRGAGAAGPRPRRAGARRPAADVPDARRPQRHAVGAPDGRAADVEPAGQRGRAGRRCSATPAAARTSRRTPRRPAPTTCPGCRRRSSTSGPRTRSATRTSTTRRGSGRPAASPSCTSGPAATTASTGSSRTAGLSKAAVAARANWLARLLAP